MPVVGLILIIFISLISNSFECGSSQNTYNSSSDNYSTNNKESSEPKKYESKLQKVPYPKHGEVKLNFKGSKLAPFQINTEEEGYYLVKLEKADDKSKYITIFIDGGKQFETNVPLGNYKLKYAYGIEWYGYDHLFGEDTKYSEAGEEFNFSRSRNRVNGVSVTLYSVYNGNLNTYDINESEF